MLQLKDRLEPNCLGLNPGSATYCVTVCKLFDLALPWFFCFNAILSNYPTLAFSHEKVYSPGQVVSEMQVKVREIKGDIQVSGEQYER